MLHKLIYCITFIYITASCRSSALPTRTLQSQIQHIISTKNAVVGVAIMGDDGRDTLSINGHRHFPLQSVFKFHLGLAVLARVDEGKLSLDQKVHISEHQLLPNLYSPLREKYPKGGELTLSEIIEYTVASSDNVGCDALIRLLGGPEELEDYFIKNGFKDISIKYNEEDQQANWNLQFHNWTTPVAANQVLQAFYKNHRELLSKKSHAFIWKIMSQSTTGQRRLKGQLPANIKIAHKTGSSGRNAEGITAAVNDIGVILLPNGRHFYISVFVTDSKESAETNEKIIADIAKTAWNHFIKELN